ncbi:MAG TPA: RsmB/NOP family class I SAM-dependent RNA methyltransferase [Opitutaceae bacterium]|nr:RsmB/NOP family class I SAM-dependent RNA methyltransferase [Opitutaceae bacterium]
MNTDRIIRNQQQTFANLFAQLRPLIRTDRIFPARLQKLLASNPSFGSRDRRLYRELLYTAVRYLPWVEPQFDRDEQGGVCLVAWLSAEIPATQKFKALPDWSIVSGHDLSLTDKSAFLAKKFRSDTFSPDTLLPAWFREQCPEAYSEPELSSLLNRAPLWLRLQISDSSDIFPELAERNWPVRRSSILESAIEVLTEADVTTTQAYQNGQVEIQDLGSQLLLETCGLELGGRWLDACAGAGGKTLQLAQLLGPSGAIDAYDVRPQALSELSLRARRAGLRTIRTLSREPTQVYDGVLVDAPCSGSGTWRRAPHLKWQTTPERMANAAQLQKELLNKFSSRVRPGGTLIYATCSLCSQENEDVVKIFLSEHPEFELKPLAKTFDFSVGPYGLTILPARLNSDGFFVSQLRKS